MNVAAPSAAGAIEGAAARTWARWVASAWFGVLVLLLSVAEGGGRAYAERVLGRDAALARLEREFIGG